MEQVVRVKQCHSDGTATVICLRESACSGDCHKCSGCGAAKETILLEAENPIGARTGELVTLRSATAPVLKAAAVMYMLPLVLFFAGYGLGEMWNAGGPVGGICFVFAIALAVVYDRKVVKKQKTVHTIIGYAGNSLA